MREWLLLKTKKSFDEVCEGCNYKADRGYQYKSCAIPQIYIELAEKGVMQTLKAPLSLEGGKIVCKDKRE